MTRARTKSPADKPKPRKKLSLTKKTVRDLALNGRAAAVKGGGRINGSVV